MGLSGVRGEKRCSGERDLGGGGRGGQETYVTSWFIFLSRHRQACMRPHTPPKSFMVCVRGRIGDGGGGSSNR